jgi:hypothetical protein
MGIKMLHHLKSQGTFVDRGNIPFILIKIFHYMRLHLIMYKLILSWLYYIVNDL